MNDEQLIETQAKAIRDLQDQMAKLLSRLPAEPEAAPDPKARVPRLVWKKTKVTLTKAGLLAQIDHPGSKHKLVRTEAALEAALGDGWQMAAFPPEYPPEVSDAPDTPEIRAAEARLTAAKSAVVKAPVVPDKKGQAA